MASINIIGGVIVSNVMFIILVLSNVLSIWLVTFAWIQISDNNAPVMVNTDEYNIKTIE